MTEAQSAEQFRLLQQEIILAGEAVETLTPADARPHASTKISSNSSGVSSGALKKHSARTFPARVSTQTSSLSFLETMICCMASYLSA